MRPGYKDSASVVAHRIVDDRMVDLKMTNLSLFSSGAFSNVYRGVADEGEVHRDVAVKKTWKKNALADSSVSASSGSNREITILKMLSRLNHKNIVQLLYDFANGYVERTCYSLVFEFLPATLYSYMIQRKRQISLLETKMFTWQMFRGQAHLMKGNIMHRDIKPQNLLVDPATGLLKISDFGSSAIVKEGARLPSYHVTRYYRPPELLLESRNYGCEIDVWSCGCVFGELLCGHILLPGRSASHQLDLVIETFGLPNRDQAAAMHCPVRTFDAINNKNYVVKKYYPRLQNLMPPHVPAEAIRLLARVLVYTPADRLYGMELLNDPFFMELFAYKPRRSDTFSCLGPQDLVDVRDGDNCFTAESLSREPL